MTATLAYEIINEMFYRDTGLMRPGKSYPLETPPPDDLREQFQAWHDLNVTHILAVYSFLEDAHD